MLKNICFKMQCAGFCIFSECRGFCRRTESDLLFLFSFALIDREQEPGGLVYRRYLWRRGMALGWRITHGLLEFPWSGGIYCWTGEYWNIVLLIVNSVVEIKIDMLDVMSSYIPCWVSRVLITCVAWGMVWWKSMTIRQWTGIHRTRCLMQVILSKIKVPRDVGIAKSENYAKFCKKVGLK